MKWAKTILVFGSLIFSAVQLLAQGSPCVYTLDLKDQLGDGWNGASLEVRIGTRSTVYGLSIGLGARHYLTINNGDSLRLTFRPGTVDREISYTLLDQEGAQVFSTGANPPVAGVVLRSRVVCPTCAPLPSPSVNFDDIRAFTTRMSWYSPTPTSIFILEYGPKGFVPGPGRGTQVRLASNRYTIPALKQNTNYDVYLRTFCATADTSKRIGPFSFKTRFAIDLGVSEIVQPFTDCGWDLGDTVRVLIKNYGGEPQSLIPFKYAVNGEVVGIEMPKDGVYTGVVGKDSAEIADFDNIKAFLPGDYLIEAWTEMKGDSVIKNDTIRSRFTSVPTIRSYPHLQTFEDRFTGWTIDKNSINSSWQLGTPNKRLLNQAFAGNRVWITKTNGQYNNSEVSYLVSPCLNFSNLRSDPVVSFALQLDLEGCCDAIWVELSTDGGETWDKLGSNASGINWYNDANRQVWTGNGPARGWFTASHPLPGTATAPDVRIRFGFLSDFANSYDGAMIDQFQVYVPQRDLAALNIVYTGGDNACVGLDSLVRLNIGNLSTNNQTGFSVAYRVNNGPVITENVGGLNLAPRTRSLYTFQRAFRPSVPGNYNIKAWIVGGDSQVANDTAYFSFRTLYNLPFGEDFERGGPPQDWEIDADALILRDRGNSSYTLSDNLFTGDRSFSATTPLFGPVRATDSLTFEYRLVNVQGNTVSATTLGANDNIQVQISTDCGLRYTTVMTINSQNHQASTSLRRMVIRLANFPNATIKVRFIATWGAGDYWLDLDNINVKRCGNLNLNVQVRNATASNAANGAIAIRGDGQGSPYTFRWANGNTSNELVNLRPGNYTVTVTDRNGCTEPRDIRVNFTTSTQEVLAVDQLSLAPNPTAGEALLKVQLREAARLKVQVFNTIGVLLLEVNLPESQKVEVPLDLSDYPNGMYFLRLHAKGKVRSEKLLKQ
jgi:hypothetical protein